MFSLPSAPTPVFMPLEKRRHDPTTRPRQKPRKHTQSTQATELDLYGVKCLYLKRKQFFFYVIQSVYIYGTLKELTNTQEISELSFFWANIY